MSKPNVLFASAGRKQNLPPKAARGIGQADGKVYRFKPRCLEIDFNFTLCSTARFESSWKKIEAMSETTAHNPCPTQSRRKTFVRKTAVRSTYLHWPGEIAAAGERSCCLGFCPRTHGSSNKQN
ncbi:uncharacterized protein LOC100838677 [Anopheles sinensis]|uniref:Uncharacterized protein LOC100838677 n=1 Tax=Anopheles sinensis TaxID=74873 RepID=A0A084VFF7_ANOSI|nr:uncharacterized protein LOC100838677 [Anopheles sinensis]